MNICFITEYFPESKKVEIKGGVEARCYYIARGLANRHNVTVIASWRRGEKRKEKFEGITVIRCGRHHRYTHSGAILSRLSFAFSACKAAKKLKNIDVIDGYNFISYIPANLAAGKIKAKKVATYHEVWLGEWIKNKGLITGIFGSLWERINLSLRWDKIMSVSQFTRKRILKHGISKNKVLVIPNGVDLAKYQKIKTSKFKQPTICCIARLTPKKRISDLIKALSIVKKKIPSVQCKIIGTGAEREKLGKLAGDLELSENVDFFGFVKEHEDVIKTLKQSHLFCLPSVLEGFGIVVLEAMACGVPYICSDIEPFKEVTEDGKGGLLFRQKDHKELAKKIVLLLKNKKLYNQKIKEENELVKKYDWQNIIKQVEKVYGGLQ